MPAYDNNKNPMPEKICIRNEDWSSSSISYDTYINIYEAMCKKEFMNQCKSFMRAYSGNHMFKIKVPDNMKYTEEYYTIRGAQNAVMFMHVIALASNQITSLLDKDLKVLISVEIDRDKGYKIYIDDDFLKRLESFGPDDEVLECISYNGSIWRFLNQYSKENYQGDFICYYQEMLFLSIHSKTYNNQAFGFCHVLRTAREMSISNNYMNMHIYDKGQNLICKISVKNNNDELLIFDSSDKYLGSYKIEWLYSLYESSKEEIINKIGTNIEYICDKLLDEKYDSTEAAVHISNLSRNIRSFI